MQFIDLLLVRCIFGGQIGHNNYEDFEHPTLQGALFGLYPFTQGVALGCGDNWAFSPHCMSFDTPSSSLYI